MYCRAELGGGAFVSKAQRTCSALARSERWFLALVVLGFAARVAQWLWIAVVDGRVLTIYSVPVTGARCPPPYSIGLPDGS